MKPDYNYYLNEFRQGSPAPIKDENTFKFLARIAWNRIKSYNRMRMEEKEALLAGDPPDVLLQCICAVAEDVQELVDAPKAGQIVSASNDGVSWTAKQADGNTEKNVKARINQTILESFTGTEYHTLFISCGF